MTQNSSVAVIIAAYNNEQTIGRAVKSALAEPEVAEVIVVDDASGDRTAAAALAVDDGSKRLKIRLQNKNAGPAAARNRAIRESLSPWLAVLDGDDFFLPGRMKSLLPYAGKADFIADDLWQAPENDVEARNKTLLGIEIKSPLSISFTEFVSSNLSGGRQRAELGFIKPLMRREFLAAYNVAYQENMRLGEDYELYARSLALGARLLLVPEKAYVSVVRPNSLSGHHSIADLLNLRECDAGLQQIPSLKRDDIAALRQHYRNTDCRLQWRLLIEAVKKRHWTAAFTCFMRPMPVPFYLAKQLGAQLLIRSAKRGGVRDK